MRNGCSTRLNFHFLNKASTDPSVPLLLVNGVHDSVFPIKDYYLLLEHGSPKCARFYEAGHMGFTKDTLETIMNWIYEKL